MPVELLKGFEEKNNNKRKWDYATYHMMDMKVLMCMQGSMHEKRQRENMRKERKKYIILKLQICNLVLIFEKDILMFFIYLFI